MKPAVAVIVLAFCCSCERAPARSAHDASALDATHVEIGSHDAQPAPIVAPLRAPLPTIVVAAPLADAGRRARTPDAGSAVRVALTLEHGAIRPGVALVSPPEFADVARAAVGADLATLGGCYERLLADAPRIAGHVVVHAGVRADGSTINPTITDDSAASPALERCVLQAAARWHLVTRGQTAMLEQPLDFAPRRAP
jgi:outer membrane biosynthesis protein TonB